MEAVFIPFTFSGFFDAFFVRSRRTRRDLRGGSEFVRQDRLSFDWFVERPVGADEDQDEIFFSRSDDDDEVEQVAESFLNDMKTKWVFLSS